MMIKSCSISVINVLHFKGISSNDKTLLIPFQALFGLDDNDWLFLQVFCL